jgi:CBS domain-containing protein
MKSVKQLLEGKPRALFTIAPDASVLDAMKLMAAKSIGALGVVDANGALVGILSERDYARKVILQGRVSSETKVSEIMTGQVVTVGLDDRAYACMERMTQMQFRHLPVVDAGKMIGMLSIGDLVKAVIDDQKQRIEQLERYIAS